MCPLSPQHLGLFALLLSASTPRAGMAQGPPLIPEEVRPAECPEGLSILAGNPEPRKGLVHAVYDSASNTTFVNSGRYGVAVNFREGVNFVRTEGRFSGRAPGAPAYWVLSMTVKSAEPRAIQERQLRFALADSTVLDIGSMQAAPTSFPGQTGTLENMIARLTPQQARRLAAEPTVKGYLGATAFTLSKDELGGLRGALMYAACGAGK